MMVLDPDPFVRIPLILATAVLMDIVEIVPGVKRVGEDFVDAGGCPLLSATGSDAKVVQIGRAHV